MLLLSPLHRLEGFRGFYRGFLANALRVAPQSALTLVVYEQARALLAAGRAAEG